MLTLQQIIWRCVQRHHRVLLGLLCVFWGIFLGAALWNFHTTDSSPFHVSTADTPVRNRVGIIGAYVASYYYYVFGRSAGAIVLFFLFFGYVLICGRSLRNEWERVMALLVGTTAFAILLHIHRLQLHRYPGGALGAYGASLLQGHDITFLSIILYAVLFICLVLYVRFSFIMGVHYGSRMVRILCCNRYAVTLLGITARAVTRPLLYVGSSVIKIGATRTKTAYGKARSITQLAPDGSTQDELQDDPLWFDYAHNRHMPAAQVSDNCDHATYKASSEHVQPDRSCESQEALHMDISKVETFYNEPVQSHNEVVSDNQGYESDNEAASVVDEGDEHPATEPHDEHTMIVDESDDIDYEDIDQSIEQTSYAAPSEINDTSDKCLKTEMQEHIDEQEMHDDDTAKAPYSLPSLNIFIGNKEEQDDPQIMEHLKVRAQTLQEKLERFGVTGEIVAIKRGPVVTLFEYQPSIDCKISKITSLEDDLALALQALSIRIIAPIPGKPFVGFEVANRFRKHVSFAQVARSESFIACKKSLPLILGQDTVGNNVVVDLARMPHALIAGSTGSGKSVALNAMLVSLLCKLSPEELRLVLIDPKRLEFASYADIAHLLFPIVTHPKKAAPVLTWVVHEMERRYEQIAKEGGRNIYDYNKVMERTGRKKLPFIVVVIDELADLMMTAGREIEDLIARITQMARAAGIHLIVATQRPSVDVITGLIKVNFPSRVSFRVTSKVDSRTILDCSGADKLLGRGDMLFLDAHGAGLQRLHGAYVSDKEIDAVAYHIRSQRKAVYLDLAEQIQKVQEDEDKDELFDEVLAYLDEVDEVSISLLQRKFKIGYNRSARIIDMLEAQGYIAPPGNGKVRMVIR